MPKLDLVYGVNLNVKVTPTMHRELSAIGYFRGERGRYSGVARDLLQAGISRFLASLTPEERGRYDEILNSLLISDTHR